MLINEEVFHFDKGINECHNELNSYELKETDIRIFASDLREIKVKLVDGFYTNVAVGNNEKEYFIEL